MLMLPPSVRIFLCTAPTDMRKGHDGLAALVSQTLGQDRFSGHLFVFLSRRGDRCKVLVWDRGGFVLWYKRLETGRFRLPRLARGTESLTLDAAELALLLDGVDLDTVKRPPLWQPPACAAAP